VAAIAAGKLDALVGFLGMLAGAALYAFSYDWIAANILPVGDLGKKRLPQLAALPEWVWYAGLVVMAGVVFALVARVEKKSAPSTLSKEP
jgi:xanthosine utilization system XapX-like protein